MQKFDSIHLVSIITPSYKSEKFIAQTIESVINQTYVHWEMIIVDDASPDNSNKVIVEYCIKDSRIKLIKLENSSGPAIARNRAIEEARGRFIAFLDADDLWKPTKLEKQIKFMIDRDCAFSYTAYETMNEDSVLLKKAIEPPLRLSYDDLLRSNFIGCLTAIYDIHKIGKVYMPLIKKRQDYALWLKLLKKVEYAYGIEEPLAIYRILPNSVSSNKISLVIYHYKVFVQTEKMGYLKSTYYLFWHIITKYIYR